MDRKSRGLRKAAGKKLTGRRGMTMAELLIVIAIIGVLAGVAFIAVWNYLRSLAQLERDGIAKELFVAAQNHLTAARGEGYLSGSQTTASMTEEEKNKVLGYSPSGESGVYYFVYSPSSSSYTADRSSILDLMLPFGSVDETVRAGGSYIIRYQYDTGLVLDVFYCSTTGSPKVFNHKLKKDEYDTVKGLTGTGKKAERRTFSQGGNSVLGWYGGAEAATLPTLELQAPTIKVTNKERLYVTITNPNSTKTEASLRLIIQGETSGKTHYIDITSRSDQEVVVLDDITSAGTHFSGITFNDGGLNDFIPGENLKIYAVAYSKSALANIMYSSQAVTNSLFADGTTTDTAYIENFRHLQNLDKKISDIDKNDANGKLTIKYAVQRTDLDWSTDDSSYWTTAKIKPLTISELAAGRYYPIEPDYTLSYDGGGHRILNVVVADQQDAGLFGSTSSVKAISNLELIDFSITGTSTAGALAGALTAPAGGLTVTNVLARNTDNTKITGHKISASADSGSAGGLIGKMTGGKVQYSAAAMVVSAPSGTGKSGTAGGLIGTVSDTEITGSYAGGHTKNGSYSEWIGVSGNSYDVTGAVAGGLVGSFAGNSSSGTISCSYSTCSVSGSSKAGGFAGEVTGTGGSISKCYAAGLIETDPVSAAGGKVSNKGAFAGTSSIQPSDCHYYSVVTEVKKTENSNTLFDHYLGAVEDNDVSGITALDSGAADYNEFVGATAGWSNAVAYDPVLMSYYSGKYNLKSVKRLDPDATLPSGHSEWKTLFVNTHYGDWPAPEIFIINTKQPD